ncbi:MAG TPA: flavodoxin family protein [Syntrophomonadaceae bacterium]|nr:flavodoxin family protein [Syntrophomonadaceae bacterium]
MSLSCVALACSPRKEGNTATLARRAVEGFRAGGGRAELLYLTDHKYAPCRACGACNTTGRCVLRDDAGPLFDRILACDRFILAAPIFSMGICAQAKAFIDRSQQFWANRNRLGRSLFEGANRPERRGIYIGCAGTRLPNVFDGAVQVVRYFFKILEIEPVAYLCYPGVDTEGEIYGNPAALQEAYEEGKKLAAGG